MRVLSEVRPTPEQLAVVSRNRPGTYIIRGAAGSGKTTTALLRLRALIGMFVSRRQRQRSDEPIRILVLTYNKTLRGYIEALARNQVEQSRIIDMQISTFAKWAWDQLGQPRLVTEARRRRKILKLGGGIFPSEEFLLDEVDYAIGRFLPTQIDSYVEKERTGRGLSPRVERDTRIRLIREVLRPYKDWLNDKELWDWNDLAVGLATAKLGPLYDIIIADEVQDFSANQVRAIQNHVAEEYCLTFVVDTAQRIYARGFTWQEAGIIIRPNNVMRLSNNYRNTIEIARFAVPLLDGIPVDDDGTLPDFSRCNRHGPVPMIIRGRYSQQARFAIDFIRKEVDLRKESVAFLKPRGGDWFREVERRLRQKNLAFVTITRQSNWPQGHENIALSTLHSAKGLEFDHVVIIGLNEEVTPHGADPADDRLTTLRRLLAMGVGRARKSVLLGYKQDEASKLVGYLDTETYNEIDL